MKMDIKDIAGLLDSGLYVKAANPWLNPEGKLYKYAQESGFNLRPGYIIRKSAPWAKARGGVDALSEKQRSKLAEFLGVVYRGISADLEAGRKPKPASVYIKAAYPVRKKREYRSKVTPESLARLSAKIKQLRGEELTEEERRLLGIVVAARGRGALEAA
jgi:outer membrane translocation and assembly module TamA